MIITRKLDNQFDFLMSADAPELPLFITIEERFNKRAGYVQFNLNAHPSLKAQLSMFCTGDISARQCCSIIIEHFFAENFTGTSSKWDTDSSECTLIKGSLDSFPSTFACEQKSTWDHKDIYAVAKASAIINILSRSEIKIEDYYYYVSG